jgi:hypothetical protein
VARELDIQAGFGVRIESMRQLPAVSTTLAVCALGASLAQAQTLLGFRHFSFNQSSQLVYHDPATGSVTAAGPLIDPGHGVISVTVDRAGNRLFLLGDEVGEAGQRLWSIDPLTGAVLANPPLTGNTFMIGIEWDEGEGALFGLRSAVGGGPQLATLDPATGVSTGIGPSILPSPAGLGLIVDSFALDAGGSRYFFVGRRLDDFVHRLYAVNTATGAYTEGELDDLVSGLEWDAGEGVLYATLLNPVTASGQLAKIDPATAAVTPLGTGTGVPLETSGISALDEAGNRFFVVARVLGETDARLFTFDTTDGSLDGLPTIPNSGLFDPSLDGLEWEPTPLPVTLLGLTVE